MPMQMQTRIDALTFVVCQPQASPLHRVISTFGLKNEAANSLIVGKLPRDQLALPAIGVRCTCHTH